MAENSVKTVLISLGWQESREFAEVRSIGGSEKPEGRESTEPVSPAGSSRDPGTRAVLRT